MALVTRALKIMHKIISVKICVNFKLELTFETGEARLFDMTPFLEKGVFTQLKNEDLFKQAHIAWDTVCWPNELDISPDTLYLRSEPIHPMSQAESSSHLHQAV